MMKTVLICYILCYLINSRCVSSASISKLATNDDFDLQNLENEIDDFVTKNNEDQDIGEPLNEIDFYNGLLLDVNGPVATFYDLDGSEDPILKAGLFEGDIDGVNISSIMEENDVSGRNAIVNMNVRWPNGQVPYTISSSFNSYERSVIARAMSEYHSRTCIRFLPRAQHSDYIHIMKGTGCSSAVGRQGGSQQVSLGQGCVYFGIVIHELMHAAGFWHEQSRADRDNYISIIWSNIIRGMEYNFQKYSWNSIQSLGENYDIGSIMHYESHAFAADRSKPTIVPKLAARGARMGQRNGFSTIDVRKLNVLYNCEKSTIGTKSRPVTNLITTTGGCEDGNSQCPQWAARGECTINPAWMKVNCLKSCNVCVKRKGCEDSNAQCQKWAQKNECSVNPAYMNLFCKKSCAQC